MRTDGWDADACVARVRQGDETAARELLARLHPLVLKLVRAHRPRHMDEEDLVQTVFMKVFSKLDQFSGTAPLEHWVSRIAVNTCFKALRYARVRPEIRLADLKEEEARVVEHLASTPEEIPEHADPSSRELLGRLFDRLSPEDRLVVTLLNLKEKSVAEVRQVTGWSAARVKVRAFRARQKMKRMLEDLLNERHM
ncbi:MAG: sigma-70 family RNA polymerase sigma factor [Verrucomicrobiales bacterium]|nr:sigma-70 family RNA polymerase sigma factor [Verrucomicrobiales bacterium]